MPVNLSHLLNSNPVSPPRSLENRIRSDQQSQGPSPRKLSDLLLSPEVSRIQVSLDQSDSLAGWGSSHRDDGWNNQQLAGLSSSSSSSSSSKIDQRALLLEEELMKIEVQPNVYELKLSKPAFNNSFERPITEPIYQRPIPITSFSYNSEREMLLGSRKFDSLRPFQLDKSRANPTNPHLGCDLNLGFKEAVYREESVDEGIDGLLNCLGSFVESCSDEERPSLIRRMEETSFITWRGMMTKICSSVYETSPNSGWEMNLMMFNGTIYIEEQHPINIPEQDNQLQCYHGYSYENLVSCLPSERIENVNTNIQWCSVVKTNLNRIKMIIGGEVDCIDMERYKRLRRNEELRSGLERQDNEEEREAEEIDPRDFVEIKTSMAISNEKQKRTFYRFKLLKFYLQSFLLGTPIVHVGFRDHSGVLQKSENFKTESIPQLVKSSNFKNSNSNNSYNSHFSSIKWSASLCLENGTRILKFISTSLGDNRRVRIYEQKFKEYYKDIYKRPFIGQDEEGKHKKTLGEQDEMEIFEIFKRWPVFRMRLVNDQQSNSRNKQGQGKSRGSGSTGGGAMVEIRELSFEEVLGQVQLNKLKFRKRSPSRKINSVGLNQGVGEDESLKRIGFLPLDWVLKSL